MLYNSFFSGDFFIFKIYFNWGVIALKCCAGFCCITTYGLWIGHKYTCVPSVLSISPCPPSHPSRSTQSTELSSLSYTVASCWLSILHMQWQPTPVLLPGKIPWMEEPGGLQSMGLWRVRHDWATSLSFFTFMHWRRKWQPTPVFLPGGSQGQGSLVGCRLWGHTESDTTEAT